MHRIIIGLLVLNMVGILSAQEGIDEEAIKTLINESYKALIARDGAKYLDTWAHRDPATRIAISESGINEILGWEKIKKGYEEFFEGNPEPGDTVFEYRDFTIVIHDDLAFAAFDKFVKADDEMKKQSREFRLLVKEDGRWKILSMMYVSQD